MKILFLHRGADTAVTMPPALDVIPDSAITVVNRPLFLPDFAGYWEGVAAPAYRISRLGKEISRKYASRYYDAVTLALRIVPASDKSEPAGIMSAFDGCVTLGDWMPTDGSTGELHVAWNGMESTLTMSQLRIDEVIEAVSHYCTLKTGDIVIPCTLPGVFPVEADHPFVASLNGLAMSVKIK